MRFANASGSFDLRAFGDDRLVIKQPAHFIEPLVGGVLGTDFIQALNQRMVRVHFQDALGRRASAGPGPCAA